jgi:hypothetical protein
VGRCRGSFTIARGVEDNWRVVILYGDSPRRPGTSRELILFDGEHLDISMIVERAAEAIKRSPAWEHWNAAHDAGVDKKMPERDKEIVMKGPGSIAEEKAERAREKELKEVEPDVTEYDWDIWNNDAEKRGDYGTVAG